MGRPLSDEVMKEFVNTKFEKRFREAEVENLFKTQIGGDHYLGFAIQPTEFSQRNKLGWCEANVIKYVCRHKFKNGVEDINKAIHYLEILKEIEYEVLAKPARFEGMFETAYRKATPGDVIYLDPNDDPKKVYDPEK